MQRIADIYRQIRLEIISEIEEALKWDPSMHPRDPKTGRFISNRQASAQPQAGGGEGKRKKKGGKPLPSKRKEKGEKPLPSKPEEGREKEDPTPEKTEKARKFARQMAIGLGIAGVAVAGNMGASYANASRVRLNPVTPKPKGNPVGKALPITQGTTEGSRQSIKKATERISKVHGVDDTIPSLPIGDMEGLGKMEGGVVFEGRDTPTPKAIGLNKNATTKQLTVTHEIGHLIDHQGFPGEGFSSEESPEFQGWRKAVAQSRKGRKIGQVKAFVDDQKAKADAEVQKIADEVGLAVGRDGRLVEEGTSRAREAGGERLEAAIRNQKYTRQQQQEIGYLATGREMWARAYAQYVALRSKDVGLAMEVGKFASQQWAWDDFEPIAAEMDKLFRNRGWME